MLVGRATFEIRGVRKIVEMPAPGGIAVGFQVLGGVAVVAENTWAAIRGRDELQVNWEMGPNADYDSAAFKQKLLDTVRSSAGSVRSKGDVEGALRDAAKVVTAEYYVPHLAHATMEPPAALANVTSAGCEVWAPTQNPQSARTEVARALGMSESKVTIHVTLAGGGFGRKSMSDFIVEAAILSRIMAAPVRVQWTRQDDLRHDYYHAVSAQRLEAAIDGAGNVTAWRQRTAFPTFVSTFFRLASSPGASELGMGLTDLPLAIPNVRMEAGGAKSRVRLGWLRSVCNIFHAFASGSFIDELAHARGRDPRDTWLELVGPPRAFTPKEAGLSDFKNYGESVEAYPIDVGRYRHVIERVTAMSDWGKPQKPGRALGLAAHRSFLSDVAVVVAVEKRPDGSIVVDEAWTVIDAGMVLNSDRVRAQMEGAVIFGMSIALYGEVTMKDGAVEQGSFRDYRLVRLPASPRRIHVEIVESDGPPRGVGEAGVPPVAPAIANAIFALTGERIRELPIAARLKV